MEHPVLQNRVLLLLYVILWTAVALAMAVAVAPLARDSFITCAIWGSVSAYSFGIMAIPLWNVIRYTDYSSKKRAQSFVSYVALGAASIIIWLTATYILLAYVAPIQDGNSLTLRLIPLQLVLGISFFSILVLVYDKWQLRLTEEEENTAMEEMKTQAQVSESISEEPKEVMERIAIKVRQKIEVVLVADILFIESEGDYTMIHTATNHYLKEQTMKYFEEHLPSNSFIRIHRSYIVNIYSVSKIELFEKQTHLITLKNGLQIKSSINGYKRLRSALNL